MSEEEIRRADPSEGFDPTEPQAGAIAAFAVGSVILLVITIVALTVYFNHIWEEAVYEKILAPPSEELKTLHYREDWQLTHYQYVDKKTGVVRIPLDRAMELFTQEAAQGKLFYPTQNTVPKPEEPVPPVPGAAPPAPTGSAPAAPAAPASAVPASNDKK
jgi:hypothetical protein